MAARTCGDRLARLAHELDELLGDVLVALGEREHLEHDDDEVGRDVDHVLHPVGEQPDEVVGGLGAPQLLVQQRHAQVAVVAHDLGEQPLLGAEVVMQQPARDPRLAGDMVERRAGDAALGDRRAHRVDDPLGLVPGQ